VTLSKPHGLSPSILSRTPPIAVLCTQFFFGLLEQIVSFRLIDVKAFFCPLHHFSLFLTPRTAVHPSLGSVLWRGTRAYSLSHYFVLFPFLRLHAAPHYSCHYQTADLSTKLLWEPFPRPLTLFLCLFPSSPRILVKIQLRLCVTQDLKAIVPPFILEPSFLQQSTFPLGQGRWRIPSPRVRTLTGVRPVSEPPPPFSELAPGYVTVAFDRPSVAQLPISGIFVCLVIRGVLYYLPTPPRCFYLRPQSKVFYFFFRSPVFWE